MQTVHLFKSPKVRERGGGVGGEADNTTLKKMVSIVQTISGWKCMYKYLINKLFNNKSLIIYHNQMVFIILNIFIWTKAKEQGLVCKQVGLAGYFTHSMRHGNGVLQLQR